MGDYLLVKEDLREGQVLRLCSNSEQPVHILPSRGRRLADGKI